MAYKKLKFWFDKELATMLAEKIKPIYPVFKSIAFIKEIDQDTQDLELKDRVELIADKLEEYLPESYEEALSVLMQILGPENDKETGMFTEGYWIMPIAKFVEKYGLQHFDPSIQAIKDITKRNTGEYCIRPFLEQYPAKTIKVMEKWAADKNVHVRRLASEGMRPKLPWAKKLQQFIDDPQPIVPIIDQLKDDPSKFIQKSVANNLNNILKDNYDFGMKIIHDWIEEATPARKWIIKHALRNQLKADNPAAFAVLDQLKM